MRPVERNLRRREGELDLLLRDGDELVIVEVRTVTRLGELDASDRVPVSKRRQLVRVARRLLAELPDPLPPIRFDVCVVEMEPKPVVHHFPDAFRPDEVA